MRGLAILAIILAPLFVLLGCGDRKERIPQSDWEKLISIRAEAKAYYSEVIEDEYNADAFGRPSHLEEISNRYQSLFNEQNVRLLQRIEDSFQPSPEETKVRLLRLYVVEGLLTSATSQSSDYLQTLRLQEKIADGKDSVNYLDIPTILSTETNRVRRQKLFEAQLPVLLKENAIYQKIRADEDSMLLQFGYGDMASYLEEQHDCDFNALAQLATQFIVDTDSLARALFAEFVPKLTGVQFGDFRGYDLAYLQHARSYDNHFPAAEMVNTLKQTLKEMGIAIDTFKNLKLDLEDRPNKSSRAATYPVEIPFDVRLQVKPVGGQDDYAACYHEMGHALHYLHVAERDFEFIYLGNNAVTETYAFLLEHLLDDPSYLRSNLGFAEKELKEYLRFRALTRLMYVRSYCGDFLYEQVLYSGVGDSKAAYEQIKQPLLGYPWSDVEREKYLDRADYFYSADYLRAWFLESQLKEKLKADFGDHYFTERAAGDFLKKLWSYGNRYSPEGLAAMLGINAISPQALIREIKAML